MVVQHTCSVHIDKKFVYMYAVNPPLEMVDKNIF